MGEFQHKFTRDQQVWIVYDWNGELVGVYKDQPSAVRAVSIDSEQSKVPQDQYSLSRHDVITIGPAERDVD